MYGLGSDGASDLHNIWLDMASPETFRTWATAFLIDSTMVPSLARVWMSMSPSLVLWLRHARFIWLNWSQSAPKTSQNAYGMIRSQVLWCYDCPCFIASLQVYWCPVCPNVNRQTCMYSSSYPEFMHVASGLFSLRYQTRCWSLWYHKSTDSLCVANHACLHCQGLFTEVYL